MNGDNSKPAPKPGADGAGKASAPDAKADAPTKDKGTGRVKFDDRGNAIWEWSIATGAFGREVSTERLQKLEHPALSIADDAPTPLETVRANPLGTKKGYDPYDSGKLGKPPEAPRKKDLRRLSEFLRLKKQAAGNKDDKD
ncbi:MAG: hypothetical protein WBF89_05255 [Steroidobacteraceae bacterium]